jgi:K+-transporting ATPase ATPase C chain
MAWINWKENLASLKLFILLGLIVGGLYPLVLTGVGELLFPFQAQGSLIKNNQHVIGSKLLGQSFSSPQYFVGRPSLKSYQTDEIMPEQVMLWGSITLQDFLSQQAKIWGSTNLPEELLYPSASMLDPHVSWEAIMFQLPKVAKARGVTIEELYHFVELHGFQEKLVNVLQLNLALDKEYNHS